LQQLQQLVTDLIDLLGEQNDDRTTDRSLGADLVKTKAATNNAVVMRI
jgi:hypothetical protein